MLLSACQDNTAYKLPDEAYSCKQWPEAPIGTYGYGTLGKYVVQANSSYQDCKAKLQAVKP